MNVKSWMALKLNHCYVTKRMTNKKLGVAKLQLAF